MRGTTKKKIAPLVITAIVVLLAAPLVVLTIGLGVAVQVSLGAALVLLICGAFGGAVVVGIVMALLQRLDEIDGGEEEEAGQY